MKEEQKTELKEEVTKEKLGKRTPLYKQRSSGIKEKAGFTRYQVLEKPGEIEKFMEAGWRPCTGNDVSLRDRRVQNDTQLGSVVREVVNKRPGAESQTAIWMEIENEYYEEDQRAKNAMNDAKKAAWNPKNIQASNQHQGYYGGNLDIKNKL